MARALRAWAINRGGKNSVRNLRYGPRTRLVRGIYLLSYIFRLDILNVTSKVTTMDHLRLNTIRDTKTALLDPKRYHDHPCPFLWFPPGK